AENRAEKPALIDDRPDGTVSFIAYADFNSYVNRLANALAGLGISAGDRVAWCGRNSLETMAFQQAARKLALTSVPINYRLDADEVAWILSNSETIAVWTSAEFAGLFSAAACRHVITFDLDEGRDLLAASSDREPRPHEGTPATTIIYTSGTTGR